MTEARILFFPFWRKRNPLCFIVTSMQQLWGALLPFPFGHNFKHNFFPFISCFHTAYPVSSWLPFFSLSKQIFRHPPSPPSPPFSLHNATVQREWRMQWKLFVKLPIACGSGSSEQSVGQAENNVVCLILSHNLFCWQSLRWAEQLQRGLKLPCFEHQLCTWLLSSPLTGNSVLIFTVSKLSS